MSNITKIRVTNLIGKGEITIAPIPQALKANHIVYLTDSELATHTIQIALKKGYLKKEVAEIREEEAEEFVPEPEEGGFVEVDKPSKQVSVKDLLKKFKEEEQARKDKIARENSDNAYKSMQSWNPKDKNLLSKEASQKEALDQIKSTEMELQVGDIDLGENPQPADIDEINPNVDIVQKTLSKKEIASLTKKTSNKKPSRGKKANLAKALKEAADDLKELAGKKTGAKKSLSPVGRKRPAPSADGSPSVDGFVYANESEDLGFVDQEQNYARARSHPVIGRLADLNEEVG